MKKYQLASLLWLISSLVQGQSLVDIRTQTKNVDFSGATATIPAKSGTALPATCNAGEMFFKTNNSPGQNLYTCEPANTWTQVAGSTNGTVSTATSGQFGFYAGSGNVIIGHSLTASDIPALNYQSPLTFTGSGPKTATSTGTLLTNDCAKWDASGNIIDSGNPCASIATGSVGQFGFYSASGNALTPHTLTASDIPPLSYQSPITFTGNGGKAVTSTGTLNASDCAKWDASGNIIDAGGPCANVASGTTGQFAFYSAAGTALTGHTLAASDIPTLNYQAPLLFTGSGTKTITGIAAGVSNNCAKWDANGNVIDAGVLAAAVLAAVLRLPLQPLSATFPNSATPPVTCFRLDLALSLRWAVPVPIPTSRPRNPFAQPLLPRWLPVQPASSGSTQPVAVPSLRILWWRVTFRHSLTKLL